MNAATRVISTNIKHRLYASVVLLLSILLTGCEGDIGQVVESDTVTTDNQPRTNLVFAPAAAIAAAPPPSSSLTELSLAGEIPTLDELHALVFLPNCSRCHTGGGDELPASLNLSSAADVYVSTIGTTSTEDPRLALVEPSQSTNSYLIRKLEGTQSVGQQMPLQSDPLPEWMVSAVKRWIDAGAVY